MTLGTRALFVAFALGCGVRDDGDVELATDASDASDSDVYFGDSAGVYDALCDDGLASLTFTVAVMDGDRGCSACPADAPLRVSARLFNPCPQVITLESPADCLGARWVLDDGATSEEVLLACDGPATAWPFPHGTDEKFSVDLGVLANGDYTVTVWTASSPPLQAQAAFRVGP